ncbi:hypothetical protein BDN70DRAFT_844296 [Pholiota conissans]|uniref:F-box domain-containing protein n=1 Tax=Pholiota conissans TaxID=109636 RepID=A0A9P5YS31_9AGAR|nr:hypothetical protein BDN70DRAFT_844296 [Pholiota conissans]
MTRRRRSSIDIDLALINVQLLNLGRKSDDFQRIIDDLQRMKDEIDIERKSLSAKQSELQAAKEPINWLPTELLIQIFVTLAESELDRRDSTYRPSLVISHTCAKWRAIALGTPELWSRVILHGFRKHELGQLYLTRSGRSPLEIDYCTAPDTFPTTECLQVADLVVRSKPHFARLTTLSMQTKAAIPLVYLLPTLNDHSKTLPQLRNLTLAILTANPTFFEVPTFLEREVDVVKELGSLDKVATSSSRLLHLKVEQLPLFNLSVNFVANLRSLELSFSPRKTGLTRHYYFLKMSTLCRFLAFTPLLEELILVDTVPYFDITLRLEDAPAASNVDPPLIEMQPVKLDHLKSMDWTYPFPTDVHRLFSMIETPELEKLDLWVEDSRSKRHDSLLAYPVVSSPHKFTRGVITFPSLRDLSLQCDGEDTTAYVLRKLNVPALQKMEFTNFDPSAPKGADEASSLPTFPRLESIFRDPRLLHLTHLTLSHYKISCELGRVDALLGYMPVLTSLSFDSCLGLGVMLDGLKETFVGTIKGGGVGGRSRRGVKVCPRLDSLSFWGCQDLDCASLRAVILSRNRSIDGFEEDNTHSEQGALAAVPDGATRGVTREAREGNASGGQTTEDARMGRKIKPLRSVRRHRPDMGQVGADVPSTIAATIITKEESFTPAHISFVRVVNCEAMEKEEVMSFRDLGVVDVIWTSSG